MKFDAQAPNEGRPLHFGSIVPASAYAQIIGQSGDTVQTWLKIDGKTIRKASFVSKGYGCLMISCDIAVRMIEGMRLEEAAAISQEDILLKAPSIPIDSHHCALLAASTIKKAVENYTAKQEAPRIAS